MEATTLSHTVPIGMRGPSPLLRLQSDERLITLVRRGNNAAFEILVARYQSRLLAFCRHMLGSREDAEDVLQEVFAASFNAIVADDRPIHVRPWLYRIARNRSLNHLRRTQAIGVDSMDVHISEAGMTTADKVHKREDFRLLVADVQELPETQKTALLLREIDALSYEQIAEAMETTIPSVKSLLVRARVSLAEAAEARTLTCEQVRDELGEVAEGLRRSTAPARRHVRGCERCQGFKGQLRNTNKALAAVFPVAPLLLFKKALLAQFGMSASAGAGGAAGAAAVTVASGGGASAISAGISTIATKTAATLAAAAIVTAGAVEVKHVQTKLAAPSYATVASNPPPARSSHSEPEIVAAAEQRSTPAPPKTAVVSAPTPHGIQPLAATTSSVSKVTPDANAALASVLFGQTSPVVAPTDSTQAATAPAAPSDAGAAAAPTPPADTTSPPADTSDPTKTGDPTTDPTKTGDPTTDPTKTGDPTTTPTDGSDPTTDPTSTGSGTTSGSSTGSGGTAKSGTSGTKSGTGSTTSTAKSAP
ncbi:MAG TPA: sigma-70 family RNA polymerase sigma factor [Solirubrobacteraceae bacterium]|nr:sigma-70 family RNA polymerase sigma factor [Solirubrobacteraceae bacterium]